MTFSTDLVRINGRILPNEKLYSNTKHYSSDENADWTQSVYFQPFFKSAKLQQNWVVVHPSEHDNHVKDFLRILKNVAKGMSFELPPPELFVLFFI